MPKPRRIAIELATQCALAAAIGLAVGILLAGATMLLAAA